MKKMQCKLLNGKVIASEVYVADTFASRLCGLMFTPYQKRKSILVSPTQSIHTCFMSFNIDVVFIDEKNEIVKVIKNMKPWRVTRFYWNARKALEVPSGELAIDVDVGQKVEFSNV